jgi:uncharacterized protein YndB with AHSA1/START domain
MAAIRQQINIAAPLRTVWTALTTSEGWCSFWAEEARVDGREGGRIVLTTEGDDGKPVEERGIFHEFKPTRKLEIAWDTSPARTTESRQQFAGTRLQFSISRDKDETRLALVHSGAGLLENEALRAALDKEWRNGLRTLRDALEAAAKAGAAAPASEP